MKVLLINGSPHEHGCTYTALREAADTLEKEGIETEFAWIGTNPVRGCISCGTCAKKDNNKCVFDDDVVNGITERAITADAYIIGSPVYYAGANGALRCVLDRMFYSANKTFKHKLGAGIANARRAGTTLTIDQINKYFQICQMPVVSSNYWPMTHGIAASDTEQDEEGLQAMRVLARNMAYMLKMGQAAKEAGVSEPETEDKIKTNFIR